MIRGFWLAIVILFAVLLLQGLLGSSEGFIGDPNAQQCGVQFGPCPFGTACMNGWCVGTNPPKLPEDTGLPVLPTPQEMNTVILGPLGPQFPTHY
jgi:hypothetical protein